MIPRPIILPPASPAELLSYIIAKHRYPTTLLIGSTRDHFLKSLVDAVKPLPQPDPGASEEDQDQAQQPETAATHLPHPLLKATLLQVAVSRHIRIVFIPTVTHLRAYLSVFPSTKSSKILPPPSTDSPVTMSDQPPLLLVYGFISLHRLTSEGSAQGVSSSAAALVEAAAASGHPFRPAVVEPRGSEDWDRDLDGCLEEMLPMLNGTPRSDDGTWLGTTVEIRRVLGRWFEERPEVSRDYS